MIRRHGTLLRLSLAIADASVVLLLMATISSLRFGGDWHDEWRSIFSVPWAPAILASVTWVGIMWTQGLYRLRAHWSFRSQTAAMARALASMALVTFAALFVLQISDVSRGFVLAALPSFALASLGLRGVIHLWLSTLRRRGRNGRNVLLIGSGPSAIRFVRALEAHSTLGLNVIGYLDGEANEPSVPKPCLGPVDRLAEVLHDHVVDEVAICIDLADWHLMQELVDLCRAEGKIVRIPLAGSLLSGSRTYVEDLSGIPILSLVEGPDREVGLAVKRLLDMAVASVGLIVSVPLMIVISAAIVLDSGRPILFRQQRVGLHGRRFGVVKFRTMVPDAEVHQAELAARNEINGHAFKITGDPRVTRVGRLLRRTSLDELPQLWNVLRGEMSFVGPRPPLPAEVRSYDMWHRRRLSMKPGITGLWQIQGRRDADFDRWVQMDLQYIDNWSLLLDTKIALKTVPAVLRGEGR